MRDRYLYLLGIIVLPAFLFGGCASGQVKSSFHDRSVEIAAKLAEADRLGARECSPRELARARVELEHARHESMETYYPPAWVHAEFDKAEFIADSLLENRRLAAKLGSRFRCARSGESRSKNEGGKWR